MFLPTRNKEVASSIAPVPLADNHSNDHPSEHLHQRGEHGGSLNQIYSLESSLLSLPIRNKEDLDSTIPATFICNNAPDLSPSTNVSMENEGALMPSLITTTRVSRSPPRCRCTSTRISGCHSGSRRAPRGPRSLNHSDILDRQGRRPSFNYAGIPTGPRASLIVPTGPRASMMIGGFRYRQVPQSRSSFTRKSALHQRFLRSSASGSAADARQGRTRHQFERQRNGISIATNASSDWTCWTQSPLQSRRPPSEDDLELARRFRRVAGLDMAPYNLEGQVQLAQPSLQSSPGEHYFEGSRMLTLERDTHLREEEDRLARNEMRMDTQNAPTEMTLAIRLRHDEAQSEPRQSLATGGQLVGAMSMDTELPTIEEDEEEEL
jgi:hypothetical protein